MQPSRPAPRPDARSWRRAVALGVVIGAALPAQWPAAAQAAVPAESASAPARISPYARAARSWAVARAEAAASTPTGVAQVGPGAGATHPSKKGPRR